MKRKIVVIGGVAAGPSAAAKAKRVNPDADVILYEGGEHISYGVCEIPYFISGEITDPAKLIVYTPERFLQEKNVAALTNHFVESIDPKKNELLIHDIHSGITKRDRFDKLIIATGCSSKRLGLEGENARNAFHIKNLSSAFALKKFIQEEKPSAAVIVGGGFIGIEMAESLVKAGMDVTVISKSNFPLPALEAETQKIIADEIESRKIHWIGNAVPEWFGVGHKNNIVAVGTKNESIPADLVVIAVGVEPNTSLAVSAGIKTGKYKGIMTDDRMNVPGTENIFAAGDCCEMKNIITQKPMYMSLATTASKMGWIAGENAAGGRAKFHGAVKAIGIRFFDLEIAQVGLSSSEAVQFGYQPASSTITSSVKAGMMPGNSKITITSTADKKTGKFLGASIVGGPGSISRANILAVALRHGLTVAEISDLDLIYTPPVSPLWDGAVVSALSLKKQI